MISERLAKLEAMIRDSVSIAEVMRRELLDLVAGLRAEIAPLADTHDETAHEIADRAQAAVQASMKREEQPEQASQAVSGLAASVREFEATHPKLVEIVDQLALTLSNMGI